MHVPRPLHGVPSQAEAEIVYRYTYVIHGLDHVNGLRAISKRQYIGIEQYTFSYHFINGQYFLLKLQEPKTTTTTTTAETVCEYSYTSILLQKTTSLIMSDFRCTKILKYCYFISQEWQSSLQKGIFL